MSEGKQITESDESSSKALQRAEQLAKPGKFKMLSIFTGTKIPPIPEDPGSYPEYKASFVSRWTFSWIYPMLKVSS
jgi:hypothetical protein